VSFLMRGGLRRDERLTQVNIERGLVLSEMCRHVYVYSLVNKFCSRMFVSF
jgi:hypothetical protein